MAWLVFHLLGASHAPASSQILLLIGSCLRLVASLCAGWAFPFLLSLSHVEACVWGKWGWWWSKKTQATFLPLAGTQGDRCSWESSSFLSFCTIPSCTFSTLWFSSNSFTDRETLEERSMVDWFHKFMAQRSPKKQQRAQKRFKSHISYKTAVISSEKIRVTLDLEVWPLVRRRVQQFLSL